MLGVLFAARLRHYVNFIRYHFDRRTLIILGVIAAWFVYQAGRSPADIGFTLGAFGRPGFGARWVVILAALSPTIAAILWLLGRAGVRATTDLELLRSLPVPASTLNLWLTVRHLSKTGPLLLLLALPALGGDGASGIGPAGALRAVFVLAAGFGLDYLALGLARRQSERRMPRDPAGRRLPRHVTGIPIRGGAISALIMRDLSYLVRRSRSVLVLFVAAVVAEAWIAFAASNVAHALIAAAAVHAIHAAVQMSALDVLFRRDESHAALLKALPLGGARLWRARAVFAVTILAAPAAAPLLIALVRGASLPAWGGFLLGAGLAVPICGGLLFADVHVALFPRTRVAGFLLMTALVFIVLFWFFVPIATPVLLLFLLIHWGLRAARSFDRVEFE